MNKAALVNHVAEAADLSVAQATRVVSAATETITTTLSAGDEAIEVAQTGKPNRALAG